VALNAARELKSLARFPSNLTGFGMFFPSSVSELLRACCAAVRRSLCSLPRRGTPDDQRITFNRVRQLAMQPLGLKLAAGSSNLTICDWEQPANEGFESLGRLVQWESLS
jgi:hypothetical protein